MSALSARIDGNASYQITDLKATRSSGCFYNNSGKVAACNVWQLRDGEVVITKHCRQPGPPRRSKRDVYINFQSTGFSPIALISTTSSSSLVGQGTGYDCVRTSRSRAARKSATFCWNGSSFSNGESALPTLP